MTLWWSSTRGYTNLIANFCLLATEQLFNLGTKGLG